MHLKKRYKNCIITFDIIGDSIELNQSDILESTIESLLDFKFINKIIPFNELVKIQQKYKKYIMVDYDSNPLDEFKLLSNVVYNFLILTEQNKNFFPESIELIMGADRLIIYPTEKLQIQQFGNLTFSPSIRCEWIDPLLIERIIKHI